MISFVIIESIDYCAWSRKHPEDREGQPEPPHALPVTPFQLPLIHIGDNLTLLAWPQSLKRKGHGLRPQNGVFGNSAPGWSWLSVRQARLQDAVIWTSSFLGSWLSHCR